MGFFSSLFKSFGSMLGIGGGSDKLAEQKQQELDQLKQQQTLNATNEEKNVAQFDSNTASTDTTGSDLTRRKKTQVGAGSAAVQLGLSGG